MFSNLSPPCSRFSSTFVDSSFLLCFLCISIILYVEFSFLYIFLKYLFDIGSVFLESNGLFNWILLSGFLFFFLLLFFILSVFFSYLYFHHFQILFCNIWNFFFRFLILINSFISLFVFFLYSLIYLFFYFVSNLHLVICSLFMSFCFFCLFIWIA